MVIGIVRRDRLMGNFHLVEAILTSWRVFSKLCKLLFLQHYCDINEQDFFYIMKDHNMQRKKCNDDLRLLIGAKTFPLLKSRHIIVPWWFWHSITK
jgi:hypothetical protein